MAEQKFFVLGKKAGSFSSGGEKPNKMSFYFAVLFGVVLLLFGLFFIYDMYARYLFWNDAQAIITLSEVKRTGTENLFQAAIAYQYTIGNETFDGNYVGGNSNTDAIGKTIAGNYPPGKETTIKVNPENNRESILFIEAPIMGIMTIFMAVILLFAVLAMPQNVAFKN